MIAPLVTFDFSGIDAPTAPSFLSPDFIVAKARETKADFPQYGDAYFSKYDRVARMKINNRYGQYAKGDYVAASEPTWNQAANYGAGAMCVDCITAGGWSFSAQLPDMVFVMVGEGLAVK